MRPRRKGLLLGGISVLASGCYLRTSLSVSPKIRKEKSYYEEEDRWEGSGADWVGGDTGTRNRARTGGKGGINTRSMALRSKKIISLKRDQRRKKTNSRLADPVEKP